MPRHQREPGTLPRPLAILGALALVATTTVAVRLLPVAAGEPAARPAPPRPPVTRHAPALSAAVSETPQPGFVGYVDTAREPGFDLPARARRSGVRHYLLGHLVAGGADGCSPKWASAAGTPADPGENPVANRIGPLRALGGDAAPSFGGPDGPDPAARCVRPGGLSAAYRRVAGAFGAAALDFEPGDGDTAAAALHRARALRVLQRERRLRVSYTLPLTASGLSAGDAASLRAARQAGAEVGTVNLLAEVEPRAAPAGRLHRLAAAIRLARAQIARAQAMPEPEQAWRRIALTLVLADGADLSEQDARTLTAYALRHGLAWLSLRGAAPDTGVSSVLQGSAP
ncbi:hypothetical protein MF672_027620 [Actinomadura sp. ATCC 31491]|uniref:Chitinase n=1 Tax=Actinomadura luzonensis TaxID=2805427 RepID=A0ABT0FYX3_9ACTN|nr:hypothetical protein [Actinomadura luzonensis]MCK2217532.1 hypothetical protein [Actinomadura luzonensis]